MANPIMCFYDEPAVYCERANIVITQYMKIKYVYLTRTTYNCPTDVSTFAIDAVFAFCIFCQRVQERETHLPAPTLPLALLYIAKGGSYLTDVYISRCLTTQQLDQPPAPILLRPIISDCFRGSSSYHDENPASVQALIGC